MFAYVMQTQTGKDPKASMGPQLRVMPTTPWAPLRPRHLQSLKCITASQLHRRVGPGKGGCIGPPDPPAPMRDPGSILPLMTGLVSIAGKARFASCLCPQLVDTVYIHGSLLYLHETYSNRCTTPASPPDPSAPTRGYRFYPSGHSLVTHSCCL